MFKNNIFFRTLFYIKPNYKTDEFWIYQTFSSKIWSIFFTLLLTLSILSYLKEKILSRYLGDRGNSEFQKWNEHFFHIIGLVANQCNCK